MCELHNITTGYIIFASAKPKGKKNNDLVLDNQVLNTTPQGHLSQIIN